MDDLGSHRKGDPPTGGAHVRPAVRADLARVAELAAEHAVYEKAAPPVADLAERLGVLLFDTAGPRLHCLVAVLPDGQVVGYATCSPELSTWEAREYLHMDCLYLRAESRGHGLGPLLVDAVADVARSLGIDEVQWQTPDWNEGAIRFYNRLPGHRAKPKLRYSLPVGR